MANLFLVNKYSKWYDSIINAAMSRNLDCYNERHHVIPKSLGGKDVTENLVLLTAREHFICHLLLTKMTCGRNRYKMVYAANMMMAVSKNHVRYVPTSRQYQYVKEQFAVAHSKLMLGSTQTPESNAKRSATQKGSKSYIRTDETLAKLRESKRLYPPIPWNKGKSTPLKGKTYTEIHGDEKGKLLRKSRSTALSGKTKSESTKQLWSTNRKGKTSGSANPNATPVTVNGVEYDCKLEAMAALNISLYKLNKLLISL